MFDKLQSEEKEGTPPPENEADDNYKTKFVLLLRNMNAFYIVSRSVVSKVEVVTPIMDVFTPGSEDFDVSYYFSRDICHSFSHAHTQSVIQLEDPL